MNKAADLSTGILEKIQSRFRVMALLSHSQTCEHVHYCEYLSNFICEIAEVELSFILIWEQISVKYILNFSDFSGTQCRDYKLS